MCSLAWRIEKQWRKRRLASAASKEAAAAIIEMAVIWRRNKRHRHIESEKAIGSVMKIFGGNIVCRNEMQLINIEEKASNQLMA
jgi:hypothetical protein